jgi:hypothetical protein
MANQNSNDAIYALPFGKFLQTVIELNEGAWGEEYSKSCLFAFSRWVKGRLEFPAEIDGFGAAEIVEHALSKLAPKGEDPWEYHFADLPTGDPRAEFIRTWGKIRSAANQDALQIAWTEAQRLPLRPKRSYSEKYCRFLAIAAHLQRSRPDQPICLPIERIGKLLKCDHKMVSVYRQFATQENILEPTAKAVPHRRAAEFMFALRLFNFETGEQVE